MALRLTLISFAPIKRHRPGIILAYNALICQNTSIISNISENAWQRSTPAKFKASHAVTHDGGAACSSAKAADVFACQRRLTGHVTDIVAMLGRRFQYDRR